MKIKKILAVVWGNQESQPVSDSPQSSSDLYESKDDLRIQNVEIQSVRIESVERDKECERDPDADRMNDIIRSYAKQARKMGRYTAFSLIAASWTVSYSLDNGFNPSLLVKITLIFAILYLIIDYLYLIKIVFDYKEKLIKFYDPIKGGGFKLKNGMDPYKDSVKTSNYGRYVLNINTYILAIATFSLIIHIITLFFTS